MNSRLKVAGWDKFQHYKDRSPPWIKLHKGLLDNFDFQMLPVASRALAPMIWLLASEADDGSVDANPDFLAFRLRAPRKEIVDGLKPLIDKGFLLVEQDDSTAIAAPKQNACLETEEETEIEKEGEAEAELTEPVFIELPLTGSKSHPVAASRLPYYRNLYPAVDVEAELRKMVGWLNSNPARRKTARGIEAFINSWLSRAQDSGPRIPVFGAGVNKQEALEARNRAVAQSWVAKMQKLAGEADEAV